MLLMIDNYDSFTYNLVHYFGELGEDVRVFRNDAVTLDGIAALRPDRLVLSPGPCSPAEAGICIDAIRAFAGKLPILGVCLGHQAIGAALGGKVVRAARLMHGKASRITNGRDFPVSSWPLCGERQCSATMGSANSHQLTRKGKSWTFCTSESISPRASLRCTVSTSTASLRWSGRAWLGPSCTS